MTTTIFHQIVFVIWYPKIQGCLFGKVEWTYHHMTFKVYLFKWINDRLFICQTTNEVWKEGKTNILSSTKYKICTYFKLECGGKKKIRSTFCWYIYCKVASRRLSRLVAHLRIFRLLMKGKFDAYVLWPSVKRVQNWIVD